MVCMLQLASAKPPAAFDRASPLEQFGQYVIEKREDGRAWELGRGAMGVTYRATDSILQRSVALKIISLDHAPEAATARERFLREARAAAALRHPNIATVHQFGIHEQSGQCFYAMELIEGETLEERVRRKGPCDVPMTIAIARQVANALLAAETRGLVHRDIKPDNLMMIDGGDETDFTIKVIDFGVAKALAATPNTRELTHGGFVGTPAFASPEQFTDAPVDVRSDIYSLGATLWYLLTGHMPFGDRAGAGPPPVDQLRAARVPVRLSSLLISMLSFEPAARPSVQELARRLAMVSTQVNARGPWRVSLGVAAALLALAAGGSLFLSRRSSHDPLVLGPQKSLAVLPFDDRGDEKTNSFFAAGIHDDVLVNLAKIAQLRVISANSVLQYRGVPHDLRAIGTALQVNAILEGSVTRAGNRARLNVQLIDPGNGAQIWAENYDREITDAFRIQGDLAARVASALEVKLSRGEAARLQRSPTRNGEAYLLYIEANEIAHYWAVQEELKRGEQLFEEAIRLDPQFGLAFAQLSQLELNLNEAYDPAPARYAKAMAAAKEALRLQPDLPEAHLAMGKCFAKEGWSGAAIDADKAMAEFALALRGSPNDPNLLTAIGRIERHQGKWADSTAHLEKAASLDPNTVERWHRLFFNHEITRNFAAAWKALDRVLALQPDSWYYYSHQASLLYFWKGDLRLAEQMLSRPRSGTGPEGFFTAGRYGFNMLLRHYDAAEQVLLEDPAENYNRRGLWPIPKALMLAHVYEGKGDQVKARAFFEAARPSIERTLQARPFDAGWHMVAAELYAGLGRKDDAVREARRATEIVPESTDKYMGPGMLEGLARTYLAVDEPALAIPILAHSLQTPCGIYQNELRLDPAFDRVRDDPRFQQLLAGPENVFHLETK
jgi:serine/threonine protein kinase/tetratricopeptide (TPR) repeat protein